MNLKNEIGRDVVLTLGKETCSKIELKWETFLKIDWRIYFVPDEARKNELSKIRGRYVVFIGQKNDFPEYLVYINVHDFKKYFRGFFNEKKGWKEAFGDFKLIYVWDYEKQELIHCFEIEGDKIVINPDFAYAIFKKDSFDKILKQSGQ